MVRTNWLIDGKLFPQRLTTLHSCTLSGNISAGNFYYVFDGCNQVYPLFWRSVASLYTRPSRQTRSQLNSCLRPKTPILSPIPDYNQGIFFRSFFFRNSLAPEARYELFVLLWAIVEYITNNNWIILGNEFRPVGVRSIETFNMKKLLGPTFLLHIAVSLIHSGFIYFFFQHC